MTLLIPIVLLCVCVLILAWRVYLQEEEVSRWQKHVSDLVSRNCDYMFETYSLSKKVSLLSEYIKDFCVIKEDCDPKAAEDFYNEIMKVSGLKPLSTKK